jgi:succinoglycan biosynthesis transport protein ExoP
MEIKDLILLMWRNLKWLVIGLALGAGLGIAAANSQTPIYEATTNVYVSRARQQSNADMLSLNDEQLMAINLQLARSQPVLNEVIAQLGRKVSPDSIEVSSLPNTLIIQIKVEDPNPQDAATIANLIVETLIKQNETLLSGWYTATETSPHRTAYPGPGANRCPADSDQPKQ